MSSTIEERLAAALDARAELVTPQDLRPLEMPAAPRRHARSAGVLLLAAAATAAVVSAPFVLEGDGGVSPEPGPAEPPSVGVSEPPESTAPSEPPTVPSDMTVVDRQRADVDGDGRPDRVRLLSNSPNTQEPGDGVVQVSLASGATGVAEVPFGYQGPLLPAYDIDGDGREQVLLSHTQGGDSAQLFVFTWHEDGLVRLEAPRDVPLVLELDGEGKAAHYYTDDRGLFSWRRLDPLEPPGGPWFRVEQWSWSVDGDRLVPTPAGSGCIDVTSDDPPQRCG